MEKRISQKDLARLYQRELKNNGKSAFNSLLHDKRVSETGPKRQKSIFLCHSHHDKTIVNKIIVLFNRLDTNIYVDWMDDRMPKVTSADTALKIKSKIKHCSRFLFLATYFGLKSKWCDWELGVAYSIKDEGI